MTNVLAFLRNLIRNHSKKLFAALLMALVFATLLFPFKDLGDWVSAKIYEQSGNSLYVQFDDMGLSFFPLGVFTEQVRVESQALPTLRAERMMFSPWLLGALSGKKGASVVANGLFKGDLSVDFREGEKLQAEQRVQNISLKADGLSLPQVTDYLRAGQYMNLALQGSLGLETALNLDPLLTRQPSGTMALQVSGLELPNQSIQMAPYGAIPLPSIRLGKVALEAKMGEGKLAINKLDFGSASDDLTGKVSGELSVAFHREGTGLRPQISAYDLKIDLGVKKSFMEANEKSGVGVLFALIRQFQAQAPESPRFSFRLKGPNAMGMPDFLPPQ